MLLRDGMVMKQQATHACNTPTQHTSAVQQYNISGKYQCITPEQHFSATSGQRHFSAQYRCNTPTQYFSATHQHNTSVEHTDTTLQWNTSVQYTSVTFRCNIHGERSWPSGQGVGLRTLGSWVRSPHRAWFAFEAQAISFTPNLPQYTQLQMSTDIVGKVPAMDQRPVQESQYNCSLIACAK